ncbi:MAG: DNA repair protein RecN, partial [Lachnospiraceae bacterium]|nr:DNA repair protein RecN [Lachnospiraceae bacterium]
EHQSLLYTDRQLAILDAYGGSEIASLLSDTGKAYREWNELRRELSSYEMDEESRKREMAFLEFEIHEITEAGLSDGEDEELETRYRKMGNARRIAESVNLIYGLTGYEGENGAGDQVGRALKELQQIVSLDESLQDLVSSLMDIDALLNDFNREVSGYLDELTFSEEEYYEVEKRLDVINRLKAKYGKTIREIDDYVKKQQKKL